MVLYRVLKGPTVPDRVASLDVAAVIVMATIGVLCVRTDDSSYLDVAVVLAIIVFLSTVAFGRYLERRARQ
ncbi:monovalent cation/H+ antiporter complex subunit F [Kamptonema cortianum]|nr:monovalent cation/H+ antiporter complex subunit F [Kamptonema cortianum]